MSCIIISTRVTLVCSTVITDSRTSTVNGSCFCNCHDRWTPVFVWPTTELVKTGYRIYSKLYPPKKKNETNLHHFTASNIITISCGNSCSTILTSISFICEFPHIDESCTELHIWFCSRSTMTNPCNQHIWWSFHYLALYMPVPLLT